jgi:hypothetical protein
MTTAPEAVTVQRAAETGDADAAVARDDTQATSSPEEGSSTKKKTGPDSASGGDDNSANAGQGAPVDGPLTWGVVGVRGYIHGEQIAPNGLEFDPLFSLDVDLNLWLWRQEGMYLFADTRFWGQKASPGVTNANQGAFDFSKREFDLNMGAAWNYYGPLEARAFAYSFNNLNRGTSEAHPSGYNDGVGLEQRYYIGGSYADPGGPGFDVTRANFVSAGYYPTKDMVDGLGNTYKPGPFARAYLTLSLIDSLWYLYSDTQYIATRGLLSKLLYEDGGTAVRPFQRAPGFELRFGAENNWDPQVHELETRVYLAARFIF